MIENFDDFKCRCSAINTMLSKSRDNPTLTEKQGVELKELEARDTLTDKMKERMAELIVKRENAKKVILSDGCIAYLMEEYAYRTQGMIRVDREFISQMEKGRKVEPESIKLLSIVDGVMYKDNEEGERIYNDYLSGEIDLYLGETIMSATTIGDTKSSWDYPTFLCKIHQPVTNDNELQVQGYMDISGAGEGFIANCLVNTPDYIIDSYKYRLLSKLDVVTEESPAFKEKWATFERSMRFDQIPMHQRVSKNKVEPFSAFKQKEVYDKVKICRDWLNAFNETYQNLNK